MIQLTNEQLEAVCSGDLTENEKSVLQNGNLFPEEWKRIFKRRERRLSRTTSVHGVHNPKAHNSKAHDPKAHESKAHDPKAQPCKVFFTNKQSSIRTRNDMLQITSFQKFTGHPVTEDGRVDVHRDCMYEENVMGAYFFNHHTSEILVTQFGTPKSWRDLIRKKNKKSPVKYQRLRNLLKTQGAKVGNTITIYSLDNLIQLVNGESLETTDEQVYAAIERYKDTSDANALIESTFVCAHKARF